MSTMHQRYVLVKNFGVGVLELDNVTVQFFLAIMNEEAKAQASD